MPGLFALGNEVFHAPMIASFAAFGAFAMLLLVEYSGPMVQRLRAHLGLAAAWALLVCLGTVVAHTPWLAVAVTLVVGFVVLFVGVVSSVLAASSTALLLAYILPATSPTPLSALPDKLAGVGLAVAATLPAICLLWPRANRDPLAAPAARACRAVAATLRVETARLADGAGAPSFETCETATAEVSAAAAELRAAFDAVPYRPTGLSVGSRAVVRLVDELTWLSTIMTAGAIPDGRVPACDPEAHIVRRAVAEVLARSAELLEDPRGDLDSLSAAVTDLRKAMDAMVHSSTARLPVTRPIGSTEAEIRAFISTLDVSFRAQELGFATVQIARNIAAFAAAERRSWPERLLGREPGALARPLAAARERAASHLELHSVWLHNSLRGALGLGLAVTLTEATGVRHSFWVSLGVLSVLRSNALNTGQNAMRAVAGTVAGSIIGAGLLALIGHHGTVLWVLLPIAVLLAGIAPAAISFAAGQAAFTVTLVVMFNIGQNPDWHIALLRTEDIALGCAVSVLMALFFWPRGAAAATDKALAEAYTDSARYLAEAVRFSLERTRSGLVPAAPLAEARQAAAAARRLDDAFRTYLAERGHKHVPLADMTTLVTGVVGLRLAADAVLALWQRVPDGAQSADGDQARVEIEGAAGRVTNWYVQLGDALERRTAIPDLVQRVPAAAARLVQSVREELADEDGRATADAVRIIWTGDHVDAARRLQPGLAAAAAAGAGPRRRFLGN